MNRECHGLLESPIAQHMLPFTEYRTRTDRLSLYISITWTATSCVSRSSTETMQSVCAHFKTLTCRPERHVVAS